MKIAFFDTKPYDKPSFERFGAKQGVTFKYFETKLNEDTVDLANGFDGVCVFVNDTVNARVIDRLYEMGVRLVALRCAGFNNVDMKHAHGKLHVMIDAPTEEAGGKEIGVVTIGLNDGVYRARVENVTGRHAIYLRAEMNQPKSDWMMPFFDGRVICDVEEFVFLK